MMSGEGLNSTVPPSPRNTIFPHLRAARIAVARAAGCAEQSTARSTPKPPVSAQVGKDCVPLARCSNCGCASGRVCRAVHRTLYAEAAGQLSHLRNVVGTGGENVVAEAEVDRKLNAFRNYVNADNFLCA